MKQIKGAGTIPGWAALIPFGVFLVLYLGLSLLAGDFSRVPMPAAFLIAGGVALLQNPAKKFSDKVDCFTSGMGDGNIMLMCLIFLLAGAFASVARAMGAVDAAVLITRHCIPPGGFLPGGIFIIAALISLAIGTSCGTIAALTPIALGLLPSLGLSPAAVLGIVVGGAMFGDNLSMISDTTIAATRTQNVAMQDKFAVNFRMVLPAALLVLGWYIVLGRSCGERPPALEPVAWTHLLTVVPYILILILALTGVNVVILLFGGTAAACLIGRMTGTLSGWEALDTCGKGIMGMSETMIVALLAGGVLAVIRSNGGIAYIFRRISGMIRSSRGAEAGIFILTGIVNVFTANNTVAIVVTGPIARDLGERYHCDPCRIAGIVDTASCVMQGLLPYGAQVLIAMGIAQTSKIPVSALEVVGKLYYPWVMGLAVLLNILLHHPSREAVRQ